MLKTFVISGVSTNCYLLADEKTGKAVVIDPGGSPQELLKELKNWEVVYIVLTHGHADHIAGIPAVKSQTGAQVLIHQDDAESLVDGSKSMLAFMGQKIDIPPADRLLHDGDLIEAGGIKLRVLHTPGHTPGGICLFSEEGYIFCGDTLFAGSIGRSDFPGGSHEQLVNSIQEKLMPLADDIKVYTGHGPSTTIGVERVSNPFLP